MDTHLSKSQEIALRPERFLDKPSLRGGSLNKGISRGFVPHNHGLLRNWINELFVSKNKYCRFFRSFKVLLLIIFVFYSSATAQDSAKLEEFTKKIEELTKELEGCGGDINCVKQVQQKMQALMQQYQGIPLLPPQPVIGTSRQAKCENFSPPPPGYTCLSLKITAFFSAEDKGSNWVADAYGCREKLGIESYTASLFKYEDQCEATGVLLYKDDFERFFASAYGTPEKTRILQAKGYEQWYDSDCKMYRSEFGLAPERVRIPFHSGIFYPPRVGEPTNIVYKSTEIWTTRDGQDIWGGIDLAQWGHATGERFIMTKEMMRDFVKTGVFQKSFHWRSEYPGPLPTYLDQTVHIKMEIEKTPGILAVTPDETFKSEGPDSTGNFQPPSKDYTLKNTGKSDIGFKISKTAKWLTLSKTDGTLAPGESQTVTVKINDTAKDLEEGEYKDIVVFTNTTDGKGNTSRTATLDVGEEQLWRLFLTGYEKREYAIPKWKTLKNEPIRYGGRFDYSLRVEFIVKKKRGKWKYKGGTIIHADVGYGTLYDPTYWATKQEKRQHFSKIKNLKGNPIGGSVDKWNEVRLYWPKNVHPEVYAEAKLKIPCKPMPGCQQWKSIWYASDEFLDRACDHEIPLKDGYTSPPKKPFIVERPNDELRWINYNYTLRKIYPK